MTTTAKPRFQQPTGMRGYVIMLAGQLVSRLGTAATTFALLLWLWDESGTATSVAIYYFASWILLIVLTPLAGVVTDRVDRKLILVLSDLAAALVTVGLLLLKVNGSLQLWHIYASQVLVGGFESFQFSARMAAISVLVPKDQYSRASGMRAFVSSLTQILGPAIAGVLALVIGLEGIMLVDLATFFVAMGALLLVRIPQPEISEEGKQAAGSMWHEIWFGFRYIFQRPGLTGLAMINTSIYTLSAFTYISILPAMVLARSGGSEVALATVQSVMGVGGLVGAAIMSVWSGPKRKIHGFLLGIVGSYLLGDTFFSLGQNTLAWAVGGFFAVLFIPILNAGQNAIWQAKIPPDVQGRVFAANGWLNQALMPLGFLLAGPLADRLAEPALMPGGALANSLGRLLGTGPGAGMGLMFLFSCVLGILTGLSGYLFPAIHKVEDRLPDHDAACPDLPGT